MPTLTMGAVGVNVARLHQQLKQSGFEIPAAEVNRQVFGSGTREALMRYQRQGGLTVTGEADAPTVAALASPLLDPGTVATLLDEAERRVTERTIGTPRRPGDTVPGERVPPIGPGVRPGDIRPGDIRPGDVRPGRDVQPGDVGPGPGVEAPERRISGRIFLEHGLPAAKLKLRLYQRGFGGTEKQLKEITTDDKGKYDATYRLDEGTAANIEIRTVVGQKEIPLSKTRFGAGINEQMNLVAPAILQPAAAEYTRLAADLTAQLGGDLKKLGGAREGDDRRDLTVLNRATGWDARLIALAATAVATSGDQAVGMTPDVLYALFRAGLPTDKQKLSRVSADAVANALTRARNAGVVRLDDAQINNAKASFVRFANEAQLTTPAPGSRSTYRDLLASSGLAADRRDRFAAVYLKHRGDSAQLWKGALDVGLTGPEIQALQVQGKLAYLTANNDKVMTRLRTTHQVTNPSRLVDRDLFEAEAWKREIRAVAGAATDAALDAVIPPVYGGANVSARLNAYAEDMARKVRLSYPTQVVGRMIERDQADSFRLGGARDATVMLLKNAAGQGFKFGETPVAAFIIKHPGVRAGMTNEAVGSATREMKALQRVYQISPSHEEMSTLLQLGLTSAYDVVAVPQPVFMKLYGPKFKSAEQARLVYRKAQQVTSVTYNLFTIARKLDTDVQVFGMSAPVEVRQSVRNELIKQFPTMESLFGSMDYCECEHCRSVLSPAAYLVDLLQFIDPEQTVWDGFLTQWKEMHGQVEYTAKYQHPYTAFTARRPDIPHIPLTCENTHTAMPYIDLVNEILEYYVANDKIDASAARDTGTATTAELLAEPQNVIARAYELLRVAKYPVTLPFDLWLETVRAFCDYFETPLADVLEAFRPSDALFARAQAYDRAAIFAESLRLSPAEVAIFTNPDPLKAWWELYGFDDANTATTEATDQTTKQRIDLNSAKALSRRLGVSYKEIAEIIQTGFVNPALVKLAILYKLGVSIGAARLAADAQKRAFYNQNKDLIDKERAGLSTADTQRFDALTPADWQTLKEIHAFDARVQAFVTASGLTLAQVNAALQAIPYDNVLVLADPDAGCDFDLATLRYASGRKADDIAFLKINLFVRLWRRLGWTIGETDRALQAFVPANAPFDKSTLDRQPLKTALIYIAHLKTLDEKLRVGKDSRQKLLTFWTDIGTTGKTPLYQKLFLSRTILKADDVFDHPLGEYLTTAGVAAKAQVRWHEVQKEGVRAADKIDPAAFAAVPTVKVSYDDLLEVQHLAYQGILTDADEAALAARSPSPALPGLLEAVQAKGREFLLVKGHMLALQGALGLTADDVARILTDAGKSIDTAELSLANVSLLYRYALLSKALKLSPRELIALRQLTGFNPFTPLRADPPTTIEEDGPFSQTLRFVEIAGLVKGSGLKVEDLEFILRHQFDETGKYRQNPAATRTLLTRLAAGIRAIRLEHRVPDDPAEMTDELLRTKLGLVLPPDVVERFVAMMGGTAEFTATRRGVAPADQLRPAAFEGEAAIREVRYNATLQEAALTFKGVLFDPDKAVLLALLPQPVPPAAHVPSPVLSALLDDVQAQAVAFFDKHLKKAAPNAQPAGGFLDAADYDLLFKAPAANLTEPQLQDHLRLQRKRLNEAFLPYLQQRLIRQLVVSSVTAQSAADPVLVERLLTDARVIGEVRGASAVPLIDSLVGMGDLGVNVTFFASADGTGANLSTAVVASADTGLKDAQGNPIRPNAARSARFDAYIEVPTTGAYRFFVHLDRQNAAADLRFEHLPVPLFITGTAGANNAVLGDKPGEYLELKVGVPYRLTLDVRNLGGGEARLLVQGEMLPKDSLTQLVRYPQAALARAERTIQVLTKSLQLIAALGVTEREVSYVATHAAAFGGVDFKALPTRSADDSLVGGQALFGWVQRLLTYARLKRELASGTDDLIGVLEANVTGDIERAYAALATLTRRNVDVVKATARALAAAPAFDSEKPVERVWTALQVVERFGVPVASLVQWTRIVGAATDTARFTMARDLKETLKARFDTETWQRIAQPIFDKLRQHQRDALVGYVFQRGRFDRVEQLYEYFLIDPAMEPVVQTSRIRLAISSVQLFVQRCLLNLEKDVHPSAIINAEHWEWMKRYRVWEANRKIFLFPENWLEPEFRDDKTHLFTELEGLLLQGDLSRDLVEDAFLGYLRKLEQLARLRIVAMHIEDNADPAQNTVHVFGRTYSVPHEYFYRRYAQEMWTPWEPVPAKIDGNLLAPVFWRDRLYLFWVTFVEKPHPQTSITGPRDSNNQEKTMTNVTLSELSGRLNTINTATDVEVHLHWTEYVSGEWSNQEEAVAGLITGVAVPFTPDDVYLHVSKETPVDGEERGVYIHLHQELNRSIYVAGRNSAPTLTASVNAPHVPFVHYSRRALGGFSNGRLQVTFKERVSNEPEKATAAENETILSGVPSFSLVPCDNTITLGEAQPDTIEGDNPQVIANLINSSLGEIEALMKPVFYQDKAQTLFVEPFVTERTLEGWDEWVTRTPAPEAEWDDPHWLDDIFIEPRFPWKDIDPGDPIPDFDPESLIVPKPREDWLVNPKTALVFNGALIGKGGRAEIEMRRAPHGESVDAGVGGVLVHPASGVAADTVVIVGARDGMDGSKTLGGKSRMVNIVGGGGLNAGLKDNLKFDMLEMDARGRM